MSTTIQSLIDASCLGDVPAITRILDAGPELVNAKHERATPLHFAAIEGNYEAVFLLVNLGADPHLLNGNGQSALELARSGARDSRTNLPIFPAERLGQIQSECQQIVTLLVNALGIRQGDDERSSAPAGA